MNPFDLHGPEFLVFYVILAAMTFAALYAWRRLAEPSPESGPWMRDPYHVAGLRGGPEEMVTLAAFSLLERGVLKKVGSHLAPAEGSGPAPSHAIERAVTSFVTVPRALSDIVRDRGARDSTAPFLEALRRRGLLMTDDHVRRRRIAALVAGLLLASVALAKIVVAISRGRSNVLFLLLLAMSCVWACSKWARSASRTRAGDAVLRNLQTLIGGRRARSKDTPVFAPDPEILLLAAIGGIVGSPFPRPHPPRKGDWNSSGCGSCGSSFSCGGSSGGGGSGCGGGGCGGGGCGGCGG